MAMEWQITKWKGKNFERESVSFSFTKLNTNHHFLFIDVNSRQRKQMRDQCRIRDSEFARDDRWTRDIKWLEWEKQKPHKVQIDLEIIGFLNRSEILFLAWLQLEKFPFSAFRSACIISIYHWLPWIRDTFPTWGSKSVPFDSFGKRKSCSWTWKRLGWKVQFLIQLMTFDTSLELVFVLVI